MAKDNVNYKKEIEKQLGGDNSRAAFKDRNQVICINLQADEPKQDISISTVLDAELAAASTSSSELSLKRNEEIKKRFPKLTPVHVCVMAQLIKSGDPDGRVPGRTVTGNVTASPVFARRYPLHPDRGAL